jgi:Erythromycin biosynthesis protein CIII-like, C-terminal domain
VHFIGPLFDSGVEEYSPPPWWPELDGERPVVHVTQGTVATDADQLLRPTLDALADEDMLVVATTGRDSADRLGPVPANARVERFIPHVRLLPHVDVMVTNRGFGGISSALGHGVPLVGAGDSQEKPEVLARLAWSGAGINLKTAKPTPNQVGAAVRRVLDTASYRETPAASNPTSPNTTVLVRPLSCWSGSPPAVPLRPAEAKGVPVTQLDIRERRGLVLMHISRLIAPWSRFLGVNVRQGELHAAA